MKPKVLVIAEDYWVGRLNGLFLSEIESLGTVELECLNFRSDESLFTADSNRVRVREGDKTVDVLSYSLVIYFPMYVTEARFERISDGSCGGNEVRSAEFERFFLKQWDALTEYVEWRLSGYARVLNNPEGARKLANKAILYNSLEESYRCSPWQMGNDAKEIGSMFPELRSVVIKAASESCQISEDLAFEVSWLTEPDFKNIVSDPQAPAIYQAGSEQPSELRLYAFQDEVYCVRIELGSRESVDVRGRGSNELTFVEFECDPELKDYICALCGSFGVSYCAFDLVQFDNQWKIVDANPSGTWGWLPDECQKRCGEMFAKLILRRLQETDDLLH